MTNDETPREDPRGGGFLTWARVLTLLDGDRERLHALRALLPRDAPGLPISRITEVLPALRPTPWDDGRVLGVHVAVPPWDATLEAARSRARAAEQAHGRTSEAYRRAWHRYVLCRDAAFERVAHGGSRLEESPPAHDGHVLDAGPSCAEPPPS